jgi:bifunctional DNA-binding transcriptional regulator/antitoxin component of YhaV-PrlF toxin-antitoxin module
LKTLREERRLNETKEFEKFVGRHQLGMHRLAKREEARLRFIGASPGKTTKEISEERHQDLINDLHMKYG